MRLVLIPILALSVAAVPARAAGAPAFPPPASAANVLRLHPAPWRLPLAAYAVSGVRFEPETGEVMPGAAGSAAMLGGAGARARAEARVVRHADGSRHAVLHGALNRWTVATIDDQGRLVQDCLESAAEAERFVRAGTPQRERR